MQVDIWLYEHRERHGAYTQVTTISDIVGGGGDADGLRTEKGRRKQRKRKKNCRIIYSPTLSRYKIKPKHSVIEALKQGDKSSVR